MMDNEHIMFWEPDLPPIAMQTRYTDTDRSSKSSYTDTDRRSCSYYTDTDRSNKSSYTDTNRSSKSCYNAQLSFLAM